MGLVCSRSRRDSEAAAHIKGMNFHILAIAADLATWIQIFTDARTLQQSVTNILTYLQNRAFPPAMSQPGFDIRMKAIETTANLLTVLAYLQDLAHSHPHVAFVLAVILLTAQERDHESG